MKLRDLFRPKSRDRPIPDAQDGDDPDACYRRANAAFGLADWDAALSDYDRTIALQPGHFKAHCNRGAVLERLQRLDAALASYDRAAAINPGDALTCYNRASVLVRLERFTEALADYERAIALKNDYVEAWVNRANVLQALRQDAAAVASYDAAIALAAVHAQAFQGRGTSLFNLGQYSAAIASFDQAIALQPDYKFILGMRRYARMKICDWDELAEDVRRLTEKLHDREAVCAPFPVLSLVDSPGLQRLAAGIWVREQCPPDAALGAIPARVHTGKIHVGYFSADFRHHPVSLLTAELFETHDRSRFEITAFSFGPETHDDMRSRLARAFDRFIDVRDRSDKEVALLARELGVDIAVDLGGFTEYCRTRIFALRAAPVQVSYIGYLGTMDAPYMDYLVADATLIPPSQRQHYSEKIVYLPCYQANDSQRSISERRFTRGELGLPTSAFVFSSFNSNFKIMPAAFEAWMRVLRRVEGSVLFLHAESELAARNLHKEAQRRGIDPARVMFGERVSFGDHLARFRAMDLFLDTWPYNAGATASDALWAGLPVLTCAGQAFAARVAASLLTALELPELITSTPDEYEEVAVQLAADVARLAAIREKLQRNRMTTRLFDAPRFTQALECAFTRMHARHLSSMQPEDIHPEI